MRHSMAQPSRQRFAARQAQALARGDRDLRGDDVDAGHRLGHRVLHLDARVHLEEEELLARGVDQELHRAGAAIFQPRGEAHRGLVQPRAQLRRQSGRRRLLDELLVAALHRAVALAEVHHVARAIAQHLHFDVPRRARRSAPGTRAHRRRPHPPRPRPAPAPRRDPRRARRVSCRARRRRPPP